MVSVVMPVLNEQEHVGEQLASLAAQTYAGEWELVVVDNGCTDATIEIVKSWRPSLPALRVVESRSRRGLNHARNVGAAAARGELLAYCDGDDVASSGWLAALVNVSERGDLIGGVEELELLNRGLAREWSDWAPHDGLLRGYGYLPFVSGGNMAVWADSARSLGWDEDFCFGASDVEFSWRAQLCGLRLARAPEGIMHHRLEGRLWPLVHKSYRYGLGGPQLYRSFRERGFGRVPGEARWRWLWLARHSPDLLRSPASRGRWLRLLALRLGRLAGSIRHLAFYP